MHSMPSFVTYLYSFSINYLKKFFGLDRIGSGQGSGGSGRVGSRKMDSSALATQYDIQSSDKFDNCDL
jgi:hypothetical protein